jgi:hypothetical protein
MLVVGPKFLPSASAVSLWSPEAGPNTPPGPVKWEQSTLEKSAQKFLERKKTCRTFGDGKSAKHSEK